MILILIILIIIYSIFVIIHKVPESLSETAYYWNYKLNPFTMYCIITILLLFFPWMIAGSFEYLAFIAMFGMLAAGSTPLFKDESFQKKLHYIGGIIAVLATILWAILNGFWIYVVVAIILTIIAFIVYRKSWVFIGEIITILTLCLILL